MTQQAEKMAEYLRLHAANGTIDQLPEGSINALFNKADAETRAYMKEKQAIVKNFRESGGRSMPFQPKHDFNDLPIDKDTRAVIDRADTEDVIHGLNSRMGTPTQDNSPPSMRDYIDAAFDSEGGNTD